MEALVALKASVSSDGKPDEFELLDSSGKVVEDLKAADALRTRSPPQQFKLGSQTAFESANAELGFIDLRTVVNCWQCRELSVPQYIATSDELGIPNLKFLERTDLIEWLEGSSTESEHIKDKKVLAKSGSQAEEDVEMADASTPAEDVVEDRGALLDHTTILRGNKLQNFSNVATLGHKSLVSEFRAASAGRPSSGFDKSARPAEAPLSASAMPPLKPAKGKDPIILLSPSPSSLLNMANVQEFLEKGSFKPVLKSATSPNLLRITRNSKVIGSKVKFVVVDSVDQFKPDYWNRVVAVFVTGQSWQFRSYKWNDPNKLFQHVLGFGLVYKNDPVPDNLKQWNVKVEPIERSARFRDQEVIERVWERIEAHMMARGWPVVRAS